MLELNNLIFEQNFGYWVKIEAQCVKVTPEIPHGIRYSLTLHEPYGKRVLGYDNAHSVKSSGKFKRIDRFWDHKHRSLLDKGIP